MSDWACGKLWKGLPMRDSPHQRPCPSILSQAILPLRGHIPARLASCHSYSPLSETSTCDHIPDPALKPLSGFLVPSGEDQVYATRLSGLRRLSLQPCLTCLSLQTLYLGSPNIVPLQVSQRLSIKPSNFFPLREVPLSLLTRGHCCLLHVSPVPCPGFCYRTHGAAKCKNWKTGEQ